MSGDAAGAVPAALPPDEERRLAVLESYCVLDTPAESGFDNITRLARHFFGTRIALVSLIDRNRQWFKSRIGLGVEETHRDLAFCAHAILDDGVLVVPDATKDPRFAGNPLVTGEPNIRFYAGAPLVADGHKLGTLCVIDDAPRGGFDAREAETLTQLARLVVDELELRREVTRRQQAEAELRDRSRLLNLAEEIGQFGHWYIDFVTDTRRWSDEVYRIMGLSPQDGPPTVDMSRGAYHPDDLPKIAPLVERARATGEGFSVEARIIRPDGTLRHVFIRGMAEWGPAGRPIGLLGVVQDITDAKREEAELRSNRELLDLTVQATRDGIWDWALDTGAIWFSPTWKEQLGYRDDELANSLDMWAGLIFEEDRIAALEMVRAYNAGLIPKFEAVQRFRHKQGHTVYILSRAIHIRDAEGRVVRMVGAHTDITRDKMTEEELRLAKQTLDDAIEAVPEGLAYFDSDDRLILCNQRYREAHPLTAPLLTPGRPFEEILRAAIANGEFAANPDGPNNEAWIQAELAQHRNPGPPFERELPDGRWILVAENRTSSGALVCTRTDITERKRFEAELQRQAADMCALAEGLDAAREEADALRARAEAATQAKSEFLAAMSHEIRTPMNGIMGMTELLFDTPLTAEQHQFAQAIRSSSNALLTIINDILDISKLEAGRVTIETLPFDPADLVEGVVELLTPRAHEKGIEIGFYIDPFLRRTLLGDPTRIRQILVNLVGNAVKFTDQGSVAVELEALDATEAHLVLRMTVTDTGIGIPAEALPTLFNKFQQVDGSITRKFGGTGLGLAICRQLSELMGGSIAVESSLGAGSRFLVDLPLALLDEAPQPAEQPLAGRRALVVDDLAVNRRVLAAMLDSLGARPTTVDNGPDALEALTRAAAGGRHFDVVLVDQTMPGMGGDSLLAAIAGNPMLGGTRRVLIAGLGPAARADCGPVQGLAHAILNRPLRQSALAGCLTGLFQAAVPPSSADRQPAEGQPADRGEEPARSGSILLAEDNRTNQLFATTLLRKLGYTVEVAEDGEQAVAAACRGGIDLVLMDVQMPGMDGLEAAQAIRARGGRLAGLPIIALTADAMPGTRELCLRAGMSDYLTKPISRAGLLAALDRWMTEAGSEHAAADGSVGGGNGSGNGSGDGDPGEVLDEAVLADLVETVGADNLALIVDSFLDDVSRRLERLSAMARSVPAGDLDMRALAGEAHDLSSLAGSFGGMAVMHLAWRMEVICRNGDTAQAAQLLPVLLREAARLERSLRERTGVERPAA
ncbi:response regulator [Azospirillum sp. B21]|uniref:response regulator n=1 Tax=Azospirillum sp. B21 TaxID=2607496 RepID=UPI0011EC6659|nr:response regulator [Azospirillum sp. B21]KAA0582025.1 response regulator [Azospirillum sp. B21]